MRELLIGAGMPIRTGPFSPDSPIAPGDVGYLLTEEPDTEEYFLAMFKAGADAKQAADWMIQEMLCGDVFRDLSAHDMTMTDFPVPPEQTVRLLGLISNGTITHGIARKVFARMIDVGGGDPEAIVRERGLGQISDTGELERAVARVIAENPKPVADYRAGRKQAFAYLVGQLMRVTKGKANPQLASQLLEQALALTPPRPGGAPGGRGTG